MFVEARKIEVLVALSNAGSSSPRGLCFCFFRVDETVESCRATVMRVGESRKGPFHDKRVVDVSVLPGSHQVNSVLI
jgi:hypothetical protein